MVLKRCLTLFLRALLSLRYSLKIQGLKEVKRSLEGSQKGTLFLPNHPSEMDPVLVSLVLGAYSARPLIVDDFYYSDFLPLMKKLKAIPIPNFDNGDNAFKRRRLRIAFDAVCKALKSKERVLLYPAGQLKRRGMEVIGGKSLLSDLMKSAPNSNIVLVRTEGMWGSSFSTAIEGGTPDFAKQAKKGVVAALKNFIFFMPRRKITMTFELVKDLPVKGTKEEINAYLEHWYNQYGEHGALDKEPIYHVPYYFWKKSERSPKRFKHRKKALNIENIPRGVIDDVFKQIGLLSKKSAQEIKVEDHLSQNLSLDSLDKAELVAFLNRQYTVEDLKPDHLKTVSDVLGYASHQVKPKSDWMLHKLSNQQDWKGEKRQELRIPSKETLAEAFLDSVANFKSSYCSGDASIGLLTYQQFLIRSIILAKKLKARFPEKRIGVLLPATNACYIVIMALQLLGKIPVMLNWTVGKRNLESMKQTGEIQHVISSYAFLSQLQSVELGSIEDDLFFLEELKGSVSLYDKVKAYLLSKRPKQVFQKLASHRVSPDDPAVILFTSGTESYPKGVPLTHRNILSNLRQALASLELKSSDILYGILPPFHSFGFSITGMLPLIGGIKVAFSPNPTHAARIANGVKKWGVTFMCLAPTFLKGILRVSKPGQLDSLRLVITGAEKLPDDVKALFRKVMKGSAHLLEGYGTTECSPVVSVNLPNQKEQGVGLPLKGVEVAIVDPETEKPLPLYEKGLVVVSGDNIFPGYIGRSIESTFIELYQKRWYNTGDLGYLDERGYLTLVGRLKRFIKVGGEMISLPAMEEAILEVALKEEWKLDQDRPSFIVLPNEDEEGKPRLTLFTPLKLERSEVNNLLGQAGFSNLVKVHEIRTVNEIPILGTGKVDFQSLKTIL